MRLGSEVGFQKQSGAIDSGSHVVVKGGNGSGKKAALGTC